MRDKLNNNPTAQAALVGLLLIAAAFLLITRMGGGGGSSSTGTTVAAPSPASTALPSTETSATAATTAAATSAAASGIPLPPLPAAVSRAYDESKTVVLLVVRHGGVDDEMVLPTVRKLSGMPGLAVFVVPAQRIADYAAITLGAQVDRVPALVVLRPRRLSGGTPQATVSYGFQSPQSIVQAVLDASYVGPTETYHPN
ncbi:MAG: hypothetical protein U0R52_09360 [Solirubrobacterales bacterium]